MFLLKIHLPIYVVRKLFFTFAYIFLLILLSAKLSGDKDCETTKIGNWFIFKTLLQFDNCSKLDVFCDMWN